MDYWNIDNPLAQQGWICPKCGRVMSPSISICLYCNDGPMPAITKTTDLLQVDYVHKDTVTFPNTDTAK